jgi:hypothetical protein
LPNKAYNIVKVKGGLTMNFVYDDGGRSKYFKGENVRDCVVRSVSNATGMDYLEVYNGINAEAKKEHASKRKRTTSSARNGVYTATAKRYIERVLGWVWVPCMAIGTGCQVHLKEGELPSKGSYILNLSGHFSCWKDNELHDTYDCSRNGTRCVYGYWRAPTKEEKEMHDDVVSKQAEYKEFCENQKKELVMKRAEVKKHNDKVKKSYAPKINKLKAQLRKLEKERDSKLLPTPQLEKDAWAKKGVAR